MANNDNEYAEIFLSEALQQHAELNNLLTRFEKDSKDKNIINALFRITHTLKGNAMGMGYGEIGEISHVLEDIFAECRNGGLVLDEAGFTSIFKGVDILGSLINAVKTLEVVKYKGIKTKLEVILNRAKEGQHASPKAQEEQASTTLPVESPQENNIKTLEETNDEESVENKITFSDLVQVPVKKLDLLMNLVGELIIEKDRILANWSSKSDFSANDYMGLSRISSDLQYSVMDVRLVQVGFLFNKFHRVLRDAAASENKRVVLKLEGTETEIDRNILQVISDSLIHIIRNCVGHGIELPNERLKMKKPEIGTVTLKAKNESDSVIIEISDDGRGLNFDKIKKKAISSKLISAEEAERMSEEQLSMLIFEPGFSTQDQINTISGRGVGMDVVKKTLDSIGGSITVTSQAAMGTTIQLVLPTSMAVKSCLLFEINEDVFAIPLSYTEYVLSLYKSEIQKAGGGLVTYHLGKNIPIFFLKELFMSEGFGNQNLASHKNILNTIHPEQKLEIVIVTYNNKYIGLVVDKLLQQKEILEKPVMKPLEKVKFISGVSILGNGNVCLVLNIPQTIQALFSGGNTLKINPNVSKQ